LGSLTAQYASVNDFSAPVISTGPELAAAVEDRNLDSGSGVFQEDGFSFFLTGLACFF
jgi:hypothetical protein